MCRRIVLTDPEGLKLLNYRIILQVKHVHRGNIFRKCKQISLSEVEAPQYYGQLRFRNPSGVIAGSHAFQRICWLGAGVKVFGCYSLLSKSVSTQ